MGIICTCVPSLKPFFRRYFPKVLGSTNASGVTSHASRHASRRTHHALANTSLGGHELVSYERSRNSAACLAMPRKAKQQIGTCTSTKNESQEDILGDGQRKDVSESTNAAAASSDIGPLPSKTGSFWSDQTGVVPVSREEF